MAQTSQLRIPGPTPVPDRVNRAMAAPMINHRGPEFKALLPELESGLKWAFQTKNDMLIFPASGTGGLESAVANLLSPGERIVVVTIGAFGDRFADLRRVPWARSRAARDFAAPSRATVLYGYRARYAS